MRAFQVENWVLSIAEQVLSGGRVEDSRVELKAVWPELPEKAARRIAAHANAARGENILWIIGIDEKNQIVCGADNCELANWYPQIQSFFDGLAPSIKDYNVPFGGKNLVAMLFVTDRAPYVVKNKENDRLEVPWRDGTRTRSATRSELLKVLAEKIVTPQIEVLEGTLRANLYGSPQPKKIDWELSIELYVEVVQDAFIVIPFHRCSAQFSIFPFTQSISFTSLSVKPRFPVGPLMIPIDSPMAQQRPQSLSLTIDATQDEVIIKGPGMVFLRAYLQIPKAEYDFNQEIKAVANLLPIKSDVPISIKADFKPLEHEDGNGYRWELITEKKEEKV